MSWLSSALGGANNVVKNVGSTVKKAAVDTGHEIGRAQNKDWVKALEAAGLAATGVGAPASAALLGGASMLGGAIAPGGNIGTAAGQGVKGAALGGAAGAAGSAIRGGIGAVSNGGSVIGGVKSAASAVPGIKAVGSSLGGGSLLDAAGGFLKDHGGSIVQGLAGVDAVRQQQQARDTQNKAIGYATDSYDARAPLRSAGQAGMLNPQAPPALQAVNYGSSGNPYGKKAPIPAIAPVRPA